MYLARILLQDDVVHMDVYGRRFLYPTLVRKIKFHANDYPVRVYGSVNLLYAKQF